MRFYSQAASSAFAVCGFFTVNTLPDFTLTLYWICRCLDTRKSKDLTGILIADIVLQLLSYVAQTEREFIRQRQKEGIAAAKARGVKFGREPMQRPAEFDMIKAQWEEDNISAREAAKQLGITQKHF